MSNGKAPPGVEPDVTDRTRPEHDDPTRYEALAGFETGFRDLWWNSDFLALNARRFGTGQARAVLDVGCGTGEWGRRVIRDLAPDASLTGVDRVPEFLETARARAEQLGREGDRFVEGTAEALPFENDRFDLVTAQTVLMHVRDAATVVAEMVRVTRPSGVVLLAEPDNLAGNLAQLGGEPTLGDEDVLAITALLLACHRGKAALGEGDERVGAKLPGLLTAAGLRDVAAYTNDRCMSLVPPYDAPDQRLALQTERAWIRDGVSMLVASRGDARRLALAGGWDEARFDGGWAAMQRWMQSVDEGTQAGRYHATRGFMMVLAGGRV